MSKVDMMPIGLSMMHVGFDAILRAHHGMPMSNELRIVLYWYTCHVLGVTLHEYIPIPSSRWKRWFSVLISWFGLQWPAAEWVGRSDSAAGWIKYGTPAKTKEQALGFETLNGFAMFHIDKGATTGIPYCGVILNEHEAKAINITEGKVL